jgi:hypothetical protein
VGKRSRKQRGSSPAERRGGAPPPASSPAKKKRRGPEPRPWPERPSVTRAKNEAAREALGESRPSRASRTEAKNAEARAALDPLEPGERPRAVTAGAIVTALAATGNLIAYIAGGEIGGQRPAAAGVLGFTGLMYAMTWGLWRARYWAVLGLEALLGMIIVFFSLFALRIETLTDAVISACVLIPSGALFWFLIKAMARIQMPERPGSPQ